jgi:hypothetical protein
VTKFRHVHALLLRSIPGPKVKTAILYHSVRADPTAADSSEHDRDAVSEGQRREGQRRSGVDSGQDETLEALCLGVEVTLREPNDPRRNSVAFLNAVDNQTAVRVRECSNVAYEVSR